MPITDVNVRVYGSSPFADRVQRAVGLVKDVRDGNRVLSSISGIYKSNDKVYEASTDKARHVYISDGVAFWPGVADELQVRILATYIAHEAVHAYLEDMGSEMAGDADSGEELAISYQAFVAGQLQVPGVYVMSPERTGVSKQDKVVVPRGEGSSTKLLVLGGLAVGTYFVLRILGGQSA